MSIDGFCFDTLARACRHGNHGYFRCDRCDQRGQYINNRMVFPESNASSIELTIHSVIKSGVVIITIALLFWKIFQRCGFRDFQIERCQDLVHEYLIP